MMTPNLVSQEIEVWTLINWFDQWSLVSIFNRNQTYIKPIMHSVYSNSLKYIYDKFKMAINQN